MDVTFGQAEPWVVYLKPMHEDPEVSWFETTGREVGESGREVRRGCGCGGAGGCYCTQSGDDFARDDSSPTSLDASEAEGRPECRPPWRPGPRPKRRGGAPGRPG